MLLLDGGVLWSLDVVVVCCYVLDLIYCAKCSLGPYKSANSWSKRHSIGGKYVCFEVAR